MKNILIPSEERRINIVFLTGVGKCYFICKDCSNKFDNTTTVKCRFPDVSNADFREKMIDELSVFYVATTRARKQVYVSASQKRATGKPGKYSCFAALPGIKLADALAMGEQ